MTKNSIVIKAHNLGKQLPASNQRTTNDTTGETLRIVSDINLSIQQGESVAITGTSGSGKTTLLGLLAGLDLPSKGEVTLLEQNLSELNEDQRAALRLGNVGFVFQSFHLMDNLSALENVMLPLELDTQNRSSHAELRTRAGDALAQVGLQARLSHLPTQLSGGEQQRVALARAFVSKPRILFADEPTGNLDTKTSLEIEELLFDLQQQNNTTLVLVTHDDALAQKCETHYRIENGALVA